MNSVGRCHCPGRPGAQSGPMGLRIVDVLFIYTRYDVVVIGRCIGMQSIASTTNS